MRKEKISQEKLSNAHIGMERINKYLNELRESVDYIQSWVEYVLGEMESKDGSDENGKTE